MVAGRYSVRPMSTNGKLAPAPGASVRRELARAVLGACLLPWHVTDYLLRREAIERGVQTDLRGFAPAVEAPELPAAPPRPLRIFLSCAEASGEIHACSVVRAIRALAASAGWPEPELRAFGGAGLEAEQVATIGNPVERATMGFSSAFAGLPYYTGLVESAAKLFSEWKPDLFLPIDSPALHVPLAHVAQRYNIPVLHFVTPQYWGWAPWRVAGYAQAVDCALTILPWEPAWFERHGVHAAHVGHPLLDALTDVAVTRPSADSRDLVILPGSRGSVIDRNLPWMLAATAQAELPEGARVVILQEGREHEERVRAHIAASDVAADVRFGDLHTALAEARAALTSSGTILIDLLHHRLPAVVIYRVERVTRLMRPLLSLPHFSSVNLLAGREVLPEFGFHGEGPLEEVGRVLGQCYNDDAWREHCIAGLDQAAARLGPPGAALRAARHALSLAARKACPPS